MKIRYKRPDNKDALSLVEAARKDMEFTLTIEPTEASGPTIVRNIHESFRKLGDALLVAQGIESEDHVAPIKELMKIKAETLRPINLLDNLRRMRINVNYYGYKPNIDEVKEAISIAKSIFEPLLEVVLKKIS
ncbi:MAG: hypothetical protein AB1668_06555 [Nanoarchaeota archaeon]